MGKFHQAPRETAVKQLPAQRAQMQPKSQTPLARLVAVIGPCLSCGEMGNLPLFSPKLVPGPSRWYPFPLAVARANIREEEGVGKGK